MNLNLTKPICFFDLETTGINITHDRVVEISILKVFPNGTEESKTWLVNPEMIIPQEVIEIHGITNEKVANEPTFKELAKDIYNMIKDSDLGGFKSNRFDIPHSAEADTMATYEVLKAQIEKYEDLENDTKFLAEFSSRKKFADFAGFIAFNKKGEECFSFGKHKGKLVTEVLEKEPGYFGWLLNADFPLYTKKVLTAIKLRSFNNKI